MCSTSINTPPPEDPPPSPPPAPLPKNLKINRPALQRSRSQLRGFTSLKIQPGQTRPAASTAPVTP